MKSKILGLLAMGLLAGPMVAFSASVVDQNNPVVGEAWCLIDNLCGQSFQQGAGNISGAGIYLSPGFGTSGTITISIYQNYGGVPSGLIASGTSGIVGPSSGWVDVLWLPTSVSSLTTYYLVLSATDPALAAAQDGVGGFGDGGDYASGQAVYGGSFFYQNVDLTFRTYSDDTHSVPEPGTLALLGLGIVGVALTRRRK